MYSIDAKWMGRCVLVCCSFMLLGGCGRAKREPGARASSNAPAPPSAMSGAPTHAEIRGLSLRLMDGVTMWVAYMSGEARPVKQGEPVVLDEPGSYRLQIDRAESRIPYGDLERLVNDHVFAYKNAPIKGLHIEREHDEGEEVRLELKGHMKSFFGLPFEIEGVPEVTPDGRVRLRTKTIQSMNIKMGGLLHLLGKELGDFAKFKARGIEADGDDLILDASWLLGSTQSSGRVTGVALAPEGLVLRFGDGPPDDGGGQKENYISYRGGSIRLGRLIMVDADLMIVDADPRDPFDFYPHEMKRQISAGYVKVKDGGGLKIFAPDYAELGDSADLRPDR